MQGKSTVDRAPFDLAVALEYDSNGTEERDKAPRVIIKGNQQEAAWLVRMAKQLGVPVVEDSGAATALSELPLDEEIPEDLYQAVAVILNRLGPAT